MSKIRIKGTNRRNGLTWTWVGREEGVLEGKPAVQYGLSRTPWVFESLESAQSIAQAMARLAKDWLFTVETTDA